MHTDCTNQINTRMHTHTGQWYALYVYRLCACVSSFPSFSFCLSLCHPIVWTMTTLQFKTLFSSVFFILFPSISVHTPETLSLKHCVVCVCHMFNLFVSYSLIHKQQVVLESCICCFYSHIHVQLVFFSSFWKRYNVFMLFFPPFILLLLVYLFTDHFRERAHLCASFS